MTVAETIAVLEGGDATSLELAQQAIAKIERKDVGPGGLNGVISLCSTALAAARESDVRRGRGQLLSALDGVPILVKDCIETSDAPTTHGSTLFDGWTATRDAGSVRILRQGGCVILGKASLDDFAAATVGVSSLNGPMRHPVDPARTVGGSSGGSALAVAAQYVPLALGTDTGGSLRIPAAACGVTALRPTPGLIPGDGVFPRSFGQDVVGPIAADVEGVAMACDMYSRTREGARSTSLAAIVRRARSSPREALSGVTVGVARVGLALWGDDDSGPVVELMQRAAEVLAAAGARVVIAPVPSRELLASALVDCESAAAVDRYLAARPSAPVKTFAELVASGRFTPAAGAAFRREYDVSRDEPRRRHLVEATMETRSRLRRWTEDSWRQGDIDVVMYPTTQHVAGAIGVEQHGLYTRWAEHADLPALALPSGTVRIEMGRNLPASLELITRSHQEGLLLRVGAALEALIQASGSEGRHSD